MTENDADAIPKQSAESAVIGSCFCSAEAANYACLNVDEDHFLEARNKALFKVIRRVFQKGMSVDVVTVQEHLTAHEKSKITLPYIVDLCTLVPTAVNVRHYADLMRNRYFTAELEKKYERLKIDPFNEEVWKDAVGIHDRLSNHGQKVIKANEMAMTYSDTLERRKTGKEFKIMTGYTDLDNTIGGFHGGNLVAVGARTTLGKSALLINFALKFLKQNLRVLFISAEMIGDEIMDRIVAMGSDVGISWLRKGHFGEEDMKRINNQIATFHDQPFWCVEGGRMSMSRVRNAIEHCNPSVVFVDFIQRFTPPNPAMSRAAYYSDLANEFKALALDKKIVIFCASQLNRDLEKDNKGKGRAPQLSDFKESGGIEEAADIAFLLQAKPKEETNEVKKITLHILKHRNGPTGFIPFIFVKAKTQFFEEEETLIPQAEQNGHQGNGVPPREFDTWVK